MAADWSPTSRSIFDMALDRAAAAIRLARNEQPPDYSIADLIRLAMAGETGKRMTPELALHRTLCTEHGELQSAFGGHRFRIPGHALAARALNVATANAGGYIVGQEMGSYIAALQPSSVVLQMGATTSHVVGGNSVFPKGTGATSTYWLQSETSQVTPSDSQIGQIASTPKMLMAYTEISRQLLLQSNAEAVVRGEMQRAVATALDAAVLNGTGRAGQPLGIVNTPGVAAITGSDVSAISFNGISRTQDTIALNNAIADARLGWVAHPTNVGMMREKLRFTYTNTPLWEGAHQRGLVGDEPAMSTTNCPVGNVVYGDWARVQIVTWATPEMAVDPFTKFQQQLVGIRVMVPVDVIIGHLKAFAVLSGISS